MSMEEAVAALEGASSGVAEELACAAALRRFQRLLGAGSPCRGALQRRAEDALQRLLLAGPRQTVRWLASSCLAGVVAAGDPISVYARAGSLHAWLERPRSPGDAPARLGALACLTALHRALGRTLATGRWLSDASSAASAHMRAPEPEVRAAALSLLRDALAGVGEQARPEAQAEALRVAGRAVADRSAGVRAAAIAAAATAGGQGLATAGGLDWVAGLCVKAMEDAAVIVRDQAARALGELLALAQLQTSTSRPTAADKKQKATTDASVARLLIQPFCRAYGVNAFRVRVGLAEAWVQFLQALRAGRGLEDVRHAELGVQAVRALSPALCGMESTQLGADLKAVALNPPKADAAQTVAHARACVMYVVQAGCVDEMAEPAQRLLLDQLLQQLVVVGLSDPSKEVILRLSSQLLGTLGEVTKSVQESIQEVLLKPLSSTLRTVQAEAALAIRSLAAAVPWSANQLLSHGAETVSKLRDVLGAVPAAGAIGPGVVESLHGHALMLAAVCAAAPSLPLGVPATLPRSVLAVACDMLGQGSTKHPLASAAVREASWLMLAALISSLPAEERATPLLPRCWEQPFGGGDPEQRVRAAEPHLQAHVRSWTASMEALRAFMAADVVPLIRAGKPCAALQPCLANLSFALAMIRIPMLSAPPPTAQAAVHLFTVAVLETFLTLPFPALYKDMHTQLVALCLQPVQRMNRQAAPVAAGSRLRELLNPADAVLGPWPAGRDAMDEELRAYQGAVDGPPPVVWAPLPQPGDFPQRQPALTMLANSQLTLLGTLLAGMDTEGQLAVLQTIRESMAEASKKDKRRLPNATNACIALLCALKTSSALAPEVAQRVLDASRSLLAWEGAGADHKRAAAELVGLCGRLQAGAAAARIERQLRGEVKGSAAPAVALALGCVHRSAGGALALQALVPATIAELCTAVREAEVGSEVRAWTLHALWLVADASGTALLPLVPQVLGVAEEVLAAWAGSTGSCQPHATAGRLVNAAVAVLGPELSPTSPLLAQCQGLVEQVAAAAETDPCVHLECVLYAQQLALFSPDRTITAAVVPTLRSRLAAPQAAVRHAAVVTLHHLVQRDPDVILPYAVEEDLFSLLDNETDMRIVREVRATLERLQEAACPVYPARWLRLSSDIVQALAVRRGSAPLNLHPRSLPPSQSATPRASTAAASGSNGAEDDDDDMDVGGRASAAHDDDTLRQEPPHTPSSPLPGMPRHDLPEPRIPRWRTRIFAAECIVRIPTAVGDNPAHMDLAMAREATGAHTDWLVLHASELVGLAFKVATSAVEALHPLGVCAIHAVVQKLGVSADPDYEGHLLLEQYQAQFVSALRAAFTDGSSPLLVTAAAELAAAVVDKGLCGGDPGVVRRIVSLLVMAVQDWPALQYRAYAEAFGTQARIALLAALAAVVLWSAASDGADHREARAVIRPVWNHVRTLWLEVLQDYTVARSRIPALQGRYTPTIHNGSIVMHAGRVWQLYEQAWQPVLRALVQGPPAATRQEDSKPPASTQQPSTTSIPPLPPGVTRDESSTPAAANLKPQRKRDAVKLTAADSVAERGAPGNHRADAAAALDDDRVGDGDGAEDGWGWGQDDGFVAVQKVDFGVAGAQRPASIAAATIDDSDMQSLPNEFDDWDDDNWAEAGSGAVGGESAPCATAQSEAAAGSSRPEARASPGPPEEASPAEPPVGTAGGTDEHAPESDEFGSFEDVRMQDDRDGSGDAVPQQEALHEKQQSEFDARGAVRSPLLMAEDEPVASVSAAERKQLWGLGMMMLCDGAQQQDQETALIALRWLAGQPGALSSPDGISRDMCRELLAVVRTLPPLLDACVSELLGVLLSSAPLDYWQEADDVFAAARVVEGVLERAAADGVVAVGVLKALPLLASACPQQARGTLLPLLLDLAMRAALDANASAPTVSAACAALRETAGGVLRDGESESDLLCGAAVEAAAALECASTARAAIAALSALEALASGGGGAAVRSRVEALCHASIQQGCMCPWPATQSAVLQSVVLQLREKARQGAYDDGGWAAGCLLVAGPHAAQLLLAATLLQQSEEGSLAADCLAVLAALPALAPGDGERADVLAMTLPVLATVVNRATPAGNAAGAAAVALIVQLATALPTAFRQSVAALPAPAKAALQFAIQASATAHAATHGPSSGASRHETKGAALLPPPPPSIALKTSFALPKPS
eukprot:jgi/Chlat1/4633/Chrsp3S05591